MLNQTCISFHGVFMKIFSLGVILKGESGIGKSELALSLLDRGHQLIADDIIELYEMTTLELWGQCPRALSNLLEIRGVGIFNIAELLGSHLIGEPHPVNLVIRLNKAHNLPPRLQPATNKLRLLNSNIDQIELEYKESRPLTMIIETIVRQHQLSLRGNSALSLPTMPERIHL